MSDDIATITDGSAPAPGDAAAPIVLGGDDKDVAVIKADGVDPEKLPERAKQNDDGSVELPLFVPVVLRWQPMSGGEITTDPPITSITFRRLNGKDVRKVMNAGGGDKYFDALTAAAVQAQFPNAAKWTQVFDRMDGADSAACIKIAQYFLDNGPRTPGPNSSRR